MKNNILKYGLPAIFWMTFTLPAIAGPGDPDDGGDDPPASIDNFMMILILAGIGLGVYFILKYRKKTQIIAK